MGMAFDFLLGFEMPRWLRSRLPKIGASLPEVALPTEAEKFIGVNAGASGLNVGPDAEKLNSLLPGVNVGPEAEKLNSLLPGVNAGAATLILLPLPMDRLLKWLDVADIDGAKDWKVLTLYGLKLN